jgi:hypothetical protein
MDIAKLSITIVDVVQTQVGPIASLKIGDIPAKIIEPKASLLKLGLVYLGTVDRKNGNWEKLVQHKQEDGYVLEGCSSDPRLVTLATRILGDGLSELDIGTVIAPAA